MKAPFLGALLLAIGLPLHAQQFITPQRDITRISVNGIELQMLHTEIDSLNPHTYRAITIFRANDKGPAQLIPFEVNEKLLPTLELQSGADCAISGFRALKLKNGLRVIYAKREGLWADGPAIRPPWRRTGRRISDTGSSRRMPSSATSSVDSAPTST